MITPIYGDYTDWLRKLCNIAEPKIGTFNLIGEINKIGVITFNIIKRIGVILLIGVIQIFPSQAQINKVVKIDTAVVVATRGQFSVDDFIKLVREDTSFYKAFQNLHYLPYKIIAALAVVNRDDDEKASMYRIGEQHVANGLKWIEIKEEKV